MTTAAVVFFPLDRQLRVEGRQWSEGLCKLAVWLDGLVTFAHTESVLHQVGQLHMSDSTAWRELQRRGAQAVAIEAAQRGVVMAAPDRKHIVPGEKPSAERLAATMDGQPEGVFMSKPVLTRCSTESPISCTN